MYRRKMWRKIGILVMMLVLCSNIVTARAQDLSGSASVYQARWQILQTCVIDCTILSNRIASIYTNAVAAELDNKIKVTATLTRFDATTNTWTDLCSITDTGYGHAMVETDYMIPNEEATYYNRSNIVTYNDDGSVAERIEVYSEGQYFPGN